MVVYKNGWIGSIWEIIDCKIIPIKHLFLPDVAGETWQLFLSHKLLACCMVIGIFGQTFPSCKMYILLMTADIQAKNHNTLHSNDQKRGESGMLYIPKHKWHLSISNVSKLGGQEYFLIREGPQCDRWFTKVEIIAAICQLIYFFMSH